LIDHGHEHHYLLPTAKELELRYPHGRDNPARSSLLWLLVLAGAIVLLLSIALAVYVIRHRRLQRSFTSFANSHYDNRRGTTTFGTNDLEVDDQPMIRCFADDEPLIVA
jgi:phosphoglycerol transferase MdoB-like AlkP superfamily enzyme